MARGDVLLVTLPPSDRREQSGRRPAVAVQTDQAGEPMLMVAPVTSSLAALRFSFTVRVEPSPENGLTSSSIVMVFQTVLVDLRACFTAQSLSDERGFRLDTRRYCRIGFGIQSYH